jgi:hypothetical protein
MDDRFGEKITPEISAFHLAENQAEDRRSVGEADGAPMPGKNSSRQVEGRFPKLPARAEVMDRSIGSRNHVLPLAPSAPVREPGQTTTFGQASGLFPKSV